MEKYKLLFLILVLIIPIVLVNAQEYEEKIQNKPESISGIPGRNETEMNVLTLQGNKAKQLKDKLGPGMEIIKLGGVNIMAPKGTRISKQGSHIIFEDLGEYIGRRFDEIEKHLEQLENKQKELIKEIEQLKKTGENKKVKTP